MAIHNMYNKIAELYVEHGEPSKLGAANIILNMKGEILLLQRDAYGVNKDGERFEISYPEYWAAPSGGVKFFETPIRAAVRECLGETGLYLPGCFEQIALRRNPQNDADDHVFTAVIDATECDIILGEGRNYQFFSRHEINNGLKVVPYIKEIINRLEVQEWQPIENRPVSGGLFTLRAPHLLP